MSASAKRYVVGFLFVNAWVLLLHKKRPAWQAGRLNGPGGKVEPGETFLDAMQREFRKEVGSDVAHWDLFAILKGVEHDGSPYEIAFFRTELQRIYGIVALNYELLGDHAERAAWFEISRLPDAALPNLRFLIPMAYYATRHDWPYTIVEGGPNPQDRTPVADATGNP